MTQIVETTIFPPAPPSHEEEVTSLTTVERNSHTTYEENIPIRLRNLPENIVPGNFAYINNISNREMLQTAYKAINLLELWNFIVENPGPNGFMWNNDNRLNTIYEKIEELGCTGHSGGSFAFTMRAMQYIAKHGENVYRLNQLSR